MGKPKYRNVKTVVDGIKFDSKKEANHYLALKALQKSGAIANLKLQVPFPMVVDGVKICKYIADFVYDIDGERVVEDVKSPVTKKNPAYRLKRKLMLALYGIEIREV